MKKSFSHPHRDRRGSVLILAILISVTITSIVMVVAWSASTLAQAGGSLAKLDQEFFTAESGAQKVAWYCRNNKMGLITSPITGTVNGCGFSASWVTVSGSTIRITSTSTNGSIAYTVYQTATPPSSPAPAIALGDNFDNKNWDITGNIFTGGSYTNGGSGSLTGNLTYESTASSTGSVTGTITKASSAFSFMDINALGATLIADAGLTLTGTQTNHTFDFTAVPGNPKVIYVNGPVVNPTFIGSGTLYSSGAVSSLDAFGSAGSPVNIVAKAAVTLNNNITVYGTIYTGGALSRGKIDMTGMIYSAGTLTASNNGHSTFTATAAPWFDPRTSGGGSGGSSAVFSNFAGPNP